MLRIRIVAVGRLRETGLRSMAEDYTRRLRRYCDLDLREVDASRRSEVDRARTEEGERLLRGARDGGRLVACHGQGRQESSESFAAMIGESLRSGEPITFLVGGAEGIAPEVLSQVRNRISFSKMTFPHELFRVFLLEQIYRAFRILRGEPYHR